MGRIEVDLNADASWVEIRDRLGHVFGIANFSHAGRASCDFPTLAAAILDELGERSAGVVPRVGAARGQARSVHLG